MARSLLLTILSLALAASACRPARTTDYTPATVSDEAVPYADEPRGSSLVAFRSIPEGSEVFLAPLSDLGIELDDDDEPDTVRRLLGMARLSTDQTLKVARQIPNLPSIGTTPLEVTVPMGTYAVLVTAPEPPDGALTEGRDAAEYVERFERDSVRGQTMNVGIDGRIGRFYVLEVSNEMENVVQLWQKRGATFGELEAFYPSTEEFPFDDQSKIRRTLIGNGVSACQADRLLALLRRGGKVVYPEGGSRRIVLQVDKAERRVGTMLRYDDNLLVKFRPPAPWSRVQELESRPMIQTSMGATAIERLQLSDRFPPGCLPSEPMCMTGANEEPLLTLWLAPVASSETGSISGLMDSVKLEQGTATHEVVSGGLTNGQHYVVFALDGPSTTFRLLPAKGAPVPLSFDAAEPKQPVCTRAPDERPGPPPADDWSTEYVGIGELTLRVNNGSQVGVFVRIRDRATKQTVAQLWTPPNEERVAYVTGGTLEVVMKANVDGRERYFKGRPIELADAKGEATLSVGIAGDGQALEEIDAAEFDE